MSDAAKREQENPANSTGAEADKGESAMPPAPQSGTRTSRAVRGAPLSVLWFEEEVDELDQDSAGGTTTG